MADKRMTIEALAQMVKRGFDQTATKEDLKQFATKEDLQALRAEMQDGFRGVHRRIDLLHNDISDLPDIREEVKDLVQRMERVEEKIGLVR